MVRLFLVLSLPLLALFHAAIAAIDRLVGSVMATLSRPEPDLAYAGAATFAPARQPTAIAASLFNFNRHESAVARRSADRHI